MAQRVRRFRLWDYETVLPMTLNEALVLIRTNLVQTKGIAPERVLFLVCGFQPLHLATFLRACQAEREPPSPSEVLTGLYGDISGNLDRAADSAATAAAVAIEWNDIDPRLGLRAGGGWGSTAKKDILASAPGRLKLLADGIGKLAKRMPVAVLGPTLPLPPIDNTVRAQAGLLQLELQHHVAAFLLEAAGNPGVRIAQPPSASGDPEIDPKMELLAGFPYTVKHAAAVAQSLASALWQATPRKGLITDLDDTLWAGIVGEIGLGAVTWSHENHAQPHGLYQQMLGHLADCGVLLGVVSKNEPAVAQEALARTDLLLDASTLFPVMAGWGVKSKAVAEVLRVWNIGADSVVFVDDNQMELDEVGQTFPGMTCLRYPGNDAARVWQLLGQLRDLFGKPVLTEEDRLRRESIRAAEVMRDSGEAAGSPEFLRGLAGTVTLDYARGSGGDSRALELINKTNQFNLNGLRVGEGDWHRLLEQPGTLAVTASYRDKFGPLGRIGVLVAEPAGGNGGAMLRVSHWVLSCRAFSRRIEHHMLDSLLRRSGAEEIEFAFTQTERNQPLQEFLGRIGARESGRLRASHFRDVCGPLPHQMDEVTL